jgi:head-tail adaptor
MRKLTAGEVARMTTTQEESFNDQVTLFSKTSGQDSLGQVIDSFDSGNLIYAGLSTEKQQRNERGEIVTIESDAVLRVATSQSIAVGDKVNGRNVTFYVDGVQIGRNVKIATLQEIR